MAAGWQEERRKRRQREKEIHIYIYTQNSRQATVLFSNLESDVSCCDLFIRSKSLGLAPIQL